MDGQHVIWSGTSRQLLCGGLERDYAAMAGDGWDLIYIPPSPLTTPWHGLSDYDLRRLYTDTWNRQSSIRRAPTGLPFHRHAATDGLMLTILRVLSASDYLMSTGQLVAAVQAAGRSDRRQNVRAELARLVSVGRVERVRRDQYRERNS